jgi:hypothetical protein
MEHARGRVVKAGTCVSHDIERNAMNHACAGLEESCR